MKIPSGGIEGSDISTKRLEPPDSFYFSAALGWLELKNHAEAGEELARIAPDLLEHPDVLELRWAVCAAGQSWEAGLAVAKIQVRVSPQRCSGWVNRAYALRRAKSGELGLSLAWEALLPAFERFPEETIIPFNLACYAAQFGRVAEAWDWLQKAMGRAGNIDDLRARALADADLEPLWNRLRAG